MEAKGLGDIYWGLDGSHSHLNVFYSESWETDALAMCSILEARFSLSGLWSRPSARFLCNVYITLDSVSFFPVSLSFYKICLVLFLCISHPVFLFFLFWPRHPNLCSEMTLSLSPFLPHRRPIDIGVPVDWERSFLMLVYNLLLVAATLVSVLTELLARDLHEVLLCATLQRSHWSAHRRLFSEKLWNQCGAGESVLTRGNHCGNQIAKVMCSSFYAFYLSGTRQRR